MNQFVEYLALYLAPDNFTEPSDSPSREFLHFTQHCCS